jgi:hypothetical protein
MADWLKWNLNHGKYGRKPWAVQMEAMRRANGQAKYGFWLEQGLGKTPLTLNEWLNSELETMVVVAPQSFKLDWTLAPREWGAAGIETGYWPKHKPPDKGKRSLYAVNYEMVRTDRGFEALEKLLTSRPSFLAFDETSCISNFESQVTKKSIQIAQLAVMVRGLNGTPLTKDVTNYWSQIRILGGLNGVNPYAFKTRFAKKGGFQGRQVIGIQNEERLTPILDKHAFRALKCDWRKDLPPQIWHEPTMVEMVPAQFRHYKAMLEEFGTVVNGREISVSLVLNRTAKLQQISSGILMDGDVAEVLVSAGANPKIQAVKDIHDAGPGKTIVSYVYRESGVQLFAALTKWGVRPAFFKGGMKAEEQNAEKRKFNEDPSCRILVAQQSAACMGHTFLGGEGEDRANRLIYYENSYWLRDRLQMNDRIHRGEQDQPCDYFDLCASPVDLVPIEALRNKKNVADYVDRLMLAMQSYRNP